MSGIMRPFRDFLILCKMIPEEHHVLLTHNRRVIYHKVCASIRDAASVTAFLLHDMLEGENIEVVNTNDSEMVESLLKVMKEDELNPLVR